MENKQIEEIANLIQSHYDCPYECATELAIFLHDEGYCEALEVSREIEKNFLAIVLDESKKKYTEDTE